MVAMTAMGTSDIARDEASMVSGLLNTTHQAGGSIGLAALFIGTVTGMTTTDTLAHG